MLTLNKKKELNIIMFHGGCIECTQQLKNGVDFCINCQYFQANWKLENLSNRPPDAAELVRQELKRKNNI